MGSYSFFFPLGTLKPPTLMAFLCAFGCPELKIKTPDTKWSPIKWHQVCMRRKCKRQKYILITINLPFCPTNKTLPQLPLSSQQRPSSRRSAARCGILRIRTILSPGRSFFFRQIFASKLPVAAWGSLVVTTYSKFPPSGDGLWENGVPYTFAAKVPSGDGCLSVCYPRQSSRERILWTRQRRDQVHLYVGNRLWKRSGSEDEGGIIITKKKKRKFLLALNIADIIYVVP